MFFDHHEHKFKILEKKIHELTLEIERQNFAITNLFHELNITPEELSQFLNNPENFSSKAQELLQSVRKSLEEKQSFSETYSPLNAKKIREAQKEIAPHWIFCR